MDTYKTQEANVGLGNRCRWTDLNTLVLADKQQVKQINNRKGGNKRQRRVSTAAEVHCNVLTWCGSHTS